MSRDVLIKDVGVLSECDIQYGGYQSQLDYEFFENFDSDHTKAAYKRDLIQFFQFLNREFGQITHPQQLQKMHVVAFRNALRAPPWSISEPAESGEACHDGAKNVETSNGTVSSLPSLAYFGQNEQGADRLAATQVEPPFERPLYVRAERRLMAGS